MSAATSLAREDERFDASTLLVAAAIVNHAEGFKRNEEGVYLCPKIETRSSGVTARPKGRALEKACAVGTNISSGSGSRRNRTEDAMMALFAPWLSADEPMGNRRRNDALPRVLSLPSNWPWTPTPVRVSRADFDRPDPEPGKYTAIELLLAHDLIGALVHRRYASGPMAERLFDEAWTQFVVGPRAPGLSWKLAAQRAYWRGEIALRSPEDLARMDAKEK